MINVTVHIREERINYSVNDFVPMAIHLGKKVNNLKSREIKHLNKIFKLKKLGENMRGYVYKSGVGKVFESVCKMQVQ